MGIGVAGPQWHALAAGCWSRLMVGRIVFHGRWVAILLTLVLASACSLLEKSARVEAPVHDLAPGQFVWLPEKIGRASCRERGGLYVEISVVAGTLKKK